ncbi:TfoX/Sxy family protein [Sporolactobacillus shoreicorticis]|uniref:TfoX/Sxy family protein n=1 Tax=Sporolactobacillus shoreicorticis TaxID=1923877 RepID=A0ABW5S7I2_9BACL|nr:TfoX/Sxy family protein [Sporolactobacillus shoreicorticis]MCO7126946.1 TfoX/Sxy family protein [Sporolactobacillus shoreicorticis]
MTELSGLPNLGPVLIKELYRIHISTAEELRAAGSERAYLAIKEIDPSACLCKLYALDGAIRGIRWHSLPANRKKELKKFFKSHTGKCS